MENLKHHIEVIRSALQEAQREQLKGSSDAMESLVALNTEMLEMEFRLEVAEKAIEHG
jgi:hypothetical protein